MISQSEHFQIPMPVDVLKMSFEGDGSIHMVHDTFSSLPENSLILMYPSEMSLSVICPYPVYLPQTLFLRNIAVPCKNNAMALGVEVSFKYRLTLPHSMGRQISVKIPPGTAPEDVLICSPQPLCLFHSPVKCLGAFHELRDYFYEAAFERDLHSQTLMAFKELKCHLLQRQQPRSKGQQEQTSGVQDVGVG